MSECICEKCWNESCKKQSEKMRNKKLRVCKYMKEHPEEWKDWEIRDFQEDWQKGMKQSK